ncbi:zinc finger protein 93-like [Bradysia coprophila]|uniref:zinc finger protein 93-like n=1 Tax=Bradysia coprophila TaxID=38358 RepID=UPI00187DAAF3|nr:zinc finger protein 93-like [Bradysia coprophila]
MDQYYIRNEHLVLRNTYDLCRFCLCVRLNMRRVQHADLQKTNIPQLYEDATTQKLDISDEYPELICPKCEKNMQLAAKIRKDFLKVDQFWRTFLTNHSKYNPIPLDQLAPIESPAPVRVVDDNSSYLQTINHNVPVNAINPKNEVGVQTLDVKNVHEKFHSNANIVPYREANGTITDLSIEEVKIESYVVYENVKCEFADDKSQFGDGNKYSMDSDGQAIDEDSKDPTIQSDDKNVNANDAWMKRRSGRKYPKNRNIHGTNPIKGEKMLFKCPENECKQECDELSDLHQHSLDAHALNQMSCDYCLKIFTKKGDLRLHVKTHIEKYCSYCKRNFSTISRWKTHMKENHDGGNKTFKCEICEKTLKNSDSYKKHMTITHSGNQNLVCHICGKTCKNSQYLHVHLRTHTEKEKLFKCSYCDKKFKLKYSKKLHERVHTGERPYMCDTCGFSFTQRGLLIRHKELHNKPKKKKLPRIINKQHGNVKCELCDSVFSNIVNMKSHLTKKHKHVGSTIWEMKLNTTCMKCHKTFTDVEELQAHKKTHLEFVCNICKSRYSNVRSLEQHIAKHADKDRPFKCDECGAAYIRKSHLQQHYTGMHTKIRPHICMFCNKAFAQTFQLKTHIKLVHHKEKPYRCKHCERAFSTSVQLNQHMQYHTGNFRYQCIVCEKCFITHQALTKHMRNSKSCRGKLAESQATKKPIPPPEIPLAPPEIQVKPIVVSGIPAMQPVTDASSIDSMDTTSIVQTISDSNHHTVMSLDQIRSLETLQTLPVMNPIITITSMSGMTTMSADSTIQAIMPLIGEPKDVDRFY